LERRIIRTSAGKITLAYTHGGLYSLDLPGPYTGVYPIAGAADPAWLHQLQEELVSYFCGLRVSFSCPLDLTGYTPFFRQVLQAALTIPYGELRTYRWLAEQVASPRAARAAGQVMAKNRTPVVIPCHRVVRSDGGLGRYSGGEGWKEKLLRLEKSRGKSCLT
jgi:methylated-DNA-[protein]-cysteine S-methyltransferase